jgi:hypothetical protein
MGAAAAMKFTAGNAADCPTACGKGRLASVELV